MAHLRLTDVTVHLPIYSARTRSLKSRLVQMGTGGRIVSESGQHTFVEALAGITLNLSDGDRLGIIGHNGAGKTTLLRVLAGVYQPASGTLDRAGRVAPLFDISVGLDPESTGNENIVLRGLYMGLQPAEIRALAPAIAEFSELGDFLDMPIRTYSSGMQMRLAFAVATSIGTDILLLDEWLSVGDVTFVDKARERMRQVVGRSNILVLASHDLDLIAKTCNQAVHLEHGRVRALGGVDEVIAGYLAGREASPAVV